MRRLLSVIALVAVVFAVAAQAQHVPVGANAIEIQCSAAHTATFLGAPVLDKYLLRYTAAGQDTVDQDGGKPTPTAGNVCRFTIPAAVKAVQNVEWRVQIATSNSKGVSPYSTVSAPFGELGLPPTLSGVPLARP